MTARARGLLAGAGLIALLAFSAPQIIAAFGTDRTISLYNIHTKETLTIQFKKDGKHIPAALEKINWVLRDWRRDEATKMDPELIDLLWEIHTELGSKEPIHIISAFRSRATNEMLRKTVGGQASESRHILGKAADVHFPDVPLKQLRYSALIRERGGVGYYPTSALPFVHVDTDRVRAWPRLPRYELALLFPNGATKHQPAEGGAISKDDVRIAQSRHKELAVQVAGFFDMRSQNRGEASIAVADAGNNRQAKPQEQRMAALSPADQVKPASSPSIGERLSRFMLPSQDDRNQLNQLAAMAALPQLVAAPQLARRPAVASLTASGQPAALVAGPAVRASASAQVAAIDPRQQAGEPMRLTDAGWGSGFIPAPAYDEEHPEELSYRPFPLAPLLTASASPDDPALAKLVHPDVSRTIDFLDQAGATLPMRLRPGQQQAQLMWAQQFKGEAVNLGSLLSQDAELDPTRDQLNRRVRTSGR